MLEFKVDRKNFKVDIDFDGVLAEAIKYQNYYDDVHCINLETEKPVSEEEYKDDVQKLINYIKTFKDTPELLVPMVINRIAKKKDGWFAKGRIEHITKCENTAILSEEEYGYRVLCLKAKALSADTVKVFVVEDIFKW